jgi:dUTPase
MTGNVLDKEDIYITKLAHYVENENNLKYAYDDSACFDICAAISQPKLLYPGNRLAIPTGLKFAPVNKKCWLKINARSGMALENGVIPIGGIIDTNWRGEVKVILTNLNQQVKRFISLNQDCTLELSGCEAVVEYKGNKGTKSYNLNEYFFNNTGKGIIVRYSGAEDLLPYGSLCKVQKGTLRIYTYAYIINPGDKIAQVELSTNNQANFIEISKEEFSKLCTSRGENGFGSSGKA